MLLSKWPSPTYCWSAGALGHVLRVTGGGRRWRTMARMGMHADGWRGNGAATGRRGRRTSWVGKVDGAGCHSRGVCGRA
eukprot:2852123-Alexandrium_andersonii.AAC.1